MLAALCPRCGRPSPVSIAAPERLACIACGFDGAMPAQVASELRAAAVTLGSIRQREAHAASARLRALRFARTFSGTYLALFLVIASLFGGCAGCSTCVAEERTGHGLNIAIMTAPPFAVMILLGIPAILLARRRIRKLELACAAVPPPAPSLPALCRLCGASLPPHGNAHAVACRYCGVENLVTASALSRARDHQNVVLSGFERAIWAEAEGGSNVSSVGIVLLSIATPIVPFLTMVILGLGVRSNDQTQPPADLSIEYGYAPRGKEWCFTDLRKDPSARRVNVNEVVGKRVVIRALDEERHGTAVSAYRAFLGDNEIVVRFDDGTTEHFAPYGYDSICTVEGD